MFRFRLSQQRESSIKTRGRLTGYEQHATPAFLANYHISTTDSGQPCITDLRKSEAETLLDWLESNHYRSPKLSYQANGRFTVSWQSK